MADAGLAALAHEDESITVAGTTRADASRLAGLLARHEIPVFHLAISEPALEDIFLALTTKGRSE